MEAARDADALVLVTDWPEFLDLDLSALRARMHTPLLLDGRNHIDPGSARGAGFRYIGVGRADDAWMAQPFEPGPEAIGGAPEDQGLDDPLSRPVSASPVVER